MKPFARRVAVLVVLTARVSWAEPPVAPARTEASSRSGDASVSVGLLSERGDVRSELAGFLSVEVPLERMARPRGVMVASAETEYADPSGVLGGAEPGGADETEAQGAADDEEDGVVTPALEPALLARLARDTLAAADNARGALAHDHELDGLAARSRASATLPELRLRAARSRDESLRLAPTAEDPYRFSLSGGNGTLLEAQATFRLNRLVFADEEIPVERLRIERERLSERLRARVMARVVAWHRALSHERSAADSEQRGRAALERVGAEVELDVLTNGWFAARVARLGLAPVRVERRDPGPKNPAAPQPALKAPVPAPKALRPVAPADLDAPPVSATSASPCLPMLATGSKTF